MSSHRSHRAQSTGRPSGSSRRTSTGKATAPVVLLSVLCIAAVLIMLFAHNQLLTRIGGVIAVVAAISGVILITRFKRQAETSEAELEAARDHFEEELRRESSEHRAECLELEQDYLEALRCERDEALDALREQVEELRAQLSDLTGRYYYESVSLTAEPIPELTALEGLRLNGDGAAPECDERRSAARVEATQVHANPIEDESAAIEPEPEPDRETNDGHNDGHEDEVNANEARANAVTTSEHSGSWNYGLANSYKGSRRADEKPREARGDKEEPASRRRAEEPSKAHHRRADSDEKPNPSRPSSAYHDDTMVLREVVATPIVPSVATYVSPERKARETGKLVHTGQTAKPGKPTAREERPSRGGHHKSESPVPPAQRGRRRADEHSDAISVADLLKNFSKPSQ